MVDPAEIARGWLVDEPFGPHIHWIALAEKSWPRVKPTYRYSSTTGKVEKMREYAGHRLDCEAGGNYPFLSEHCTCGVSEVLKESENG